MADRDVTKVVQQTVVVPEHVEYPSVRQTFPSGSIVKGDKVRLIVRIIDSEGVVKSETIDVVSFKEYPAAGTEVLGIVKMAFFESAIPVAE